MSTCLPTSVSAVPSAACLLAHVRSRPERERGRATTTSRVLYSYNTRAIVLIQQPAGLGSAGEHHA